MNKNLPVDQRHLSSTFTISRITAKHSNGSTRTQKTFDRAVKELSIGVQNIDIRPKRNDLMRVSENR